MKKFLKFIDSISEYTGRIFAGVILIMTLLVVLEVVMRRLFNSPTIWSFEVTIQLYAFHFMIVAAFTLKHNAHVSIDILYEALSVRKRAFLDVFTYLVFFFPFNIVLLVQGSRYAMASWAIREITPSVVGLPLYPIKTMIPITAALLLLQGFAMFVRHLHVAVTGRPYA